MGVTCPLPLFRKKGGNSGITSVAFTGDGVAIAHVTPSSSENKLTFCEFIETSSPATEVKRFSDFVSDNALSSSATIVLPTDAYQILLVERPDVPNEELVEALRWRVKDLISFDVEKALIDYVDLPDDAYRGRSKMVYVVVCKKETVMPLIEWCEEIGLQPTTVDVPELALLNVTEDLADDEAGLAVFCIGRTNSSINLMSDAALYFTRHLNYNELSDPQSASAAVLELQRSMDYYESQIGKPPCVRLMVMPMQSEDDPLLNELRYNLPLDVYSLNLENLVSTDLSLSFELQRKCTVAVAAALRTTDVLTSGEGK